MDDQRDPGKPEPQDVLSCRHRVRRSPRRSDRGQPQANADSEAVAAAHARLQQAREQAAKLRDQRRELRVRSEVADALSAFREDASRRARPTLEHETGRRALLEQLHAIADAEFRQVFVVSHTDDVVEHCDLTIEVNRDDDGVSSAAGPRR